ncbi:MAG: PQQ-binding-like beta-propeller repeat protein [Planctomycetota bacterium]
MNRRITDWQIPLMMPLTHTPAFRMLAAGDDERSGAAVFAVSRAATFKMDPCTGEVLWSAPQGATSKVDLSPFGHDLIGVYSVPGIGHRGRDLLVHSHDSVAAHFKERLVRVAGSDGSVIWSRTFEEALTGLPALRPALEGAGLQGAAFEGAASEGAASAWEGEQPWICLTDREAHLFLLDAKDGGDRIDPTTPFGLRWSELHWQRSSLRIPVVLADLERGALPSAWIVGPEPSLLQVQLLPGKRPDWSRPLPEGNFAPPTLVNLKQEATPSRLVVTTSNRELIALSAEDGSVVWTRPIDLSDAIPVAGRVAAVDDEGPTLVCQTSHRVISRLDPATGALLACYEIPAAERLGDRHETFVFGILRGPTGQPPTLLVRSMARTGNEKEPLIHQLHAFRGTTTSPVWVRQVPDTWYPTPASGDLDGDGYEEQAFLTQPWLDKPVPRLLVIRAKDGGTIAASKRAKANRDLSQIHAHINWVRTMTDLESFLRDTNDALEKRPLPPAHPGDHPLDTRLPVRVRTPTRPGREGISGSGEAHAAGGVPRSLPV